MGLGPSAETRVLKAQNENAEAPLPLTSEISEWFHDKLSVYDNNVKTSRGK